jgi:hypothetical protein
MAFIKKTIGFIILRHVNDEETNKYWQHCYECVRKFYPENSILIIDDNSNHEYLTNIKLYKTTVVYSEYNKRGELLPYIYYLQYKISDIAVILHDSVFINSFIDFNIADNCNYKLLWEFEHGYERHDSLLEKNMINVFNDKELLDFYENKTLWKGCFGAMTVITHDYLTILNRKYNLNLLVNLILNRTDRQAFERVFSCLLTKLCEKQSLFGNIHSYCDWGITFNEKNIWLHLPIIKVWTGR